MLVSVFFYEGVDYFLRSAGTYEIADDRGTLLLVLAFAALSAVAASFFVKNGLLLKATREQRRETAQVAYVVAFALSESAALLGFVALLITNSTYSYLLFALGVVGILLHKPRLDHLAAASYKNRPLG